jgi:hypothetical protein
VAALKIFGKHLFIHCVTVFPLKISSCHMFSENVYSFQGMADIHLLDGCADINSEEGRHLCQQNILQCCLPDGKSVRLL